MPFPNKLLSYFRNVLPVHFPCCRACVIYVKYIFRTSILVFGSFSQSLVLANPVSEMTPLQKWYLDLRDERIFFCSRKNGKKMCLEEMGCVTSVSLCTRGKTLVKVRF